MTLDKESKKAIVAEMLTQLAEEIEVKATRLTNLKNEAAMLRAWREALITLWSNAIKDHDSKSIAFYEKQKAEISNRQKEVERERERAVRELDAAKALRTQYKTLDCELSQ